MARKKTKKKKKSNFMVYVKSFFVSERFILLRKFVIVIVPLFIMLAAVAAGLGYLEGYVKNVAAGRKINVELEYIGTMPQWASTDLISEINMSSGVNSDDFILDDDLVKNAYNSISKNPWVESIKSIRKCYSGNIQLDYSIREPIARIIRSNSIYFIDSKGVVLPDASINKHLVLIEGNHQAIPKPGMQIKHPDIMAALDILNKIRFVDENLSNNSDIIWTEIAMIDVTNFEGRSNSSESHINLYTHQDTEIRWGAAVGREKAYWEADFTTKLTRLYRDYRDYGTLDINTTGIELRNHR